jgi:hypothetical protein
VPRLSGTAGSADLRQCGFNTTSEMERPVQHLPGLTVFVSGRLSYARPLTPISRTRIENQPPGNNYRNRPRPTDSSACIPDCICRSVSSTANSATRTPFYSNRPHGRASHANPKQLLAPYASRHRGTISFIPYGGKIPCLTEFSGGAVSNTTDLPRKASRTVSTF